MNVKSRVELRREHIINWFGRVAVWIKSQRSECVVEERILRRIPTHCREIRLQVQFAVEFPVQYRKRVDGGRHLG